MEAKEAAKKLDMGVLHIKTKRLTRSQISKMFDSHQRSWGSILSAYREKAARWVEHFEISLKQAYPLSIFALPLASKDLLILLI